MKKKLKKILIYFAIAIGYFGFLLIITSIEQQSPEGNIKNIWDAMWYSLVTLTTVGYGDYYPVTPAGKFLGIVIILGSLGILGYLLGLISNIIRNYMKKKKEGYFGVSFKDHSVILGWNNFTKLVTNQIVKANNKVAVITNQREAVDQIRELYSEDLVFCMLVASYDNYEVFEKVNIQDSISVFVNLTNDTDTLVTIINLQKRYKDIKFIVSLDKQDLREAFENIGVRHTVFRNEISSSLVASFIFEPDVAKFTEDLIMTSDNKDEYDIQEYFIGASNPFCNSDYMETFIRMKRELDCVLVGLVKIKDGERMLFKNPNEGVMIEEGDYMILISSGKSKKQIEKVFAVKEGIKQ